MELSELRSRWIELRNKKAIDPRFIYDYAIHKSMVITFETCMMVLSFYDPNAIIDRLDHEFDLTILYDKDNNFIKVLE